MVVGLGSGSTAEGAGTMTPTEPRSFARVLGVVYLGYFAVAIFGSVLIGWKTNAGVAVA